MSEKQNSSTPGDGIRSLKTSSVFRVVNFELYTKPNIVIMGLGLTALTGCIGYIAYMRYKYESLGYYGAVQVDGSEQFVKKKSKWD
ncbi:small integral membrane protein 8 [Anthonomus grandis grandis]|uniref:small integral membrane protein 8 n=1 Tax=Anthonomus grandis grandis TaxID=2921223 RepID=UPI002165D14C|nr:small integral membrane protein 8 [Anthonomus grandis grandis]